MTKLKYEMFNLYVEDGSGHGSCQVNEDSTPDSATKSIAEIGISVKPSVELLVVVGMYICPEARSISYSLGSKIELTAYTNLAYTIGL